MREPDVVGGEATSVHLQSRIMVSCGLPIGIGRDRIEVLSSAVAVALRHLATHMDQLLVPGELHQDPANSKFLKPLDSCLFGLGFHDASITADSEGKVRAEVMRCTDACVGFESGPRLFAAVPAQSSWWMPNATTKPRVVAIPTSLWPCSKASGIIVSASIARIPPAANVRMKATVSGEASWKRV
jgi:hypothetical protein